MLSEASCLSIKMSETPAASVPTAPEGPAVASDSGGASEVSTPGCPICEFIEAGPCGDQHKVWVTCRGEAKEQETDFVQHCSDTFRSFFGCMLSHQDYYRPFLDAFHVDTDLSQEAIDKANERKQHEQQQEQQQEPAAPQQQRRQTAQQQGSETHRVGGVSPAGQPAAVQQTASSTPGDAGAASSSRQQQGAGLQQHAAASTVS